jgi:hypothetical protein
VAFLVLKPVLGLLTLGLVQAGRVLDLSRLT